HSNSPRNQFPNEQKALDLHPSRCFEQLPPREHTFSFFCMFSHQIAHSYMLHEHHHLANYTRPMSRTVRSFDAEPVVMDLSLAEYLEGFGNQLVASHCSPQNSKHQC